MRPVGAQVAFTSSDPDSSQIYVVAAGGGTPVNLTNSPYNDCSPLYSPDGSRIAYISGRPGAACFAS